MSRVDAPRMLALWVPDWPVVALCGRWGGDAPEAGGALRPAVEAVAVVGGDGVLAASAPARGLGVSTGMRLRLARSLCPGLRVLRARPEVEVRAFEPVMAALGEVVADPVVARPGLALMAARGPARWAGGEQALAAKVVETVTDLTGAEGQAGVADSLLGAVMAARQGVIVPVGQAAEFLAPLPIDRLLAALTTRQARQEARLLIDTFSRLGLRRLGDLAGLPQKDVAARFGPTGALLHALAAAQEWRSPVCARPEADVQVERVLDPPVGRSDQAAFAARSLAEELSETLVRRALAAGRLQVRAQHEDGVSRSRCWRLEGVPAPADITDRVRWQLEGWLSGPGDGPVAPLTLLSLTALELRAAGAEQKGLWSQPGAQDRQRVARAAERVESLLGAGTVLSPLVEQGWDPRGRVRLLAWGEEVPAPQPALRGTRSLSPWLGAVPAPSPSVVPAQAVPARLQDAAGREVEVDAHGQASAEPHVLHVEGGPWQGSGEVAAWAGPWPVDEGWWRPQGAHRRAYMQVLMRDGQALLLVRRGRWWLEGVYD